MRAWLPALGLACMIGGCDGDPAPTPAKAVRALTSAVAIGAAGQDLPGGITVRVVDYSDRGLAGIKVRFTVVTGDGSVPTQLAVTDEEGVAHTEWTLGQTAGDNALLVSAFGIASDSNATFTATGAPGPAVRLALTPQTLRVPSSATTGQVTGRVVDQFGNQISVATSYVARDPSVATVNDAGQVSIAPDNRGTSTWIVANGGGFTDSARVFNLSSGDPPCTGIAASAPLAVGEVRVAGFMDDGICIPAEAADREYAMVPFYNSPVPSALTSFRIAGVGVKPTKTTALGGVHALVRASVPSLDLRLRESERRELAARAAGARRWFVGRRSGATYATAAPKLGDQLQLNVQADSFCSAPALRTGRVAAISQKAIVIHDLSNPSGYSDADYASFAARFDALAYPVDTANFGAPTDVDGNGRVLLFFTHAVNEAGFSILGFATARDLLPKSGPFGSCAGSNVAEILYLRVPDASGQFVNIDPIGAISHEFQHVINAGRRLFFNLDANPTEEVWLNEGLSHIAEELVFYRASGFGPRQNLGSQLANSPEYLGFGSANLNRYFWFTTNPSGQGPVGLADYDDDIETRGAAWSFLRFAADQRAAANETALWQGLVNANSAGMQNLYDNLGSDVRLLMRDWAISNFLDDLVPTDAKYSQPSWNLRQVPGFRAPFTRQLVPANQAGPTTASATVTLRALSSEFVRFGVGASQEAFVSASGLSAITSDPLPRNVLLAIVRTK